MSIENITNVLGMLTGIAFEELVDIMAKGKLANKDDMVIRSEIMKLSRERMEAKRTARVVDMKPKEEK